MKNEFEAKFLNIQREDFRNTLSQAGAKLVKADFVMRRRTFHPPVGGDKLWGRVRDEGDKITLTVKRVDDASSITGTFEAEVKVDSFDNASSIFGAIGFSSTAFQENRREIWQFGEVEVTIDEWPGIAPFTEIEGQDEASVATAAVALGFSMQNAVFGSVSEVYKRAGLPEETFIALKEVIFSNPPVVK